MDEDLKRVFASLSTGIYVLTVRDGAAAHGMSASWVTQVSARPPLLMAAVGRRHRIHAAVERDGRFGLNILGAHSRTLEDYFYSAASRRPDNLSAVVHELSPGGVPWLPAALAALECHVVAAHAAGDRSLFVARIEAVRWGAADRPLTSLDLDYVYVGEIVAQPYKSARTAG